jgi:hypothetical protein
MRNQGEIPNMYGFYIFLHLLPLGYDIHPPAYIQSCVAIVLLIIFLAVSCHAQTVIPIGQAQSEGYLWGFAANYVRGE